MRELIQQGKHEEALELGQQLLGKQPNDSLLLCQLAGIYSLVGDNQRSLQFLERAFQAGFNNYIILSHDEWFHDFKRLEPLPEYRSLVAKMRERIADQQREKAIVLREGKWTDISLQHPEGLPSVEMSLSYDAEALRIRAVVHDLHFKDSSRSWRYGDGFLINFVTPSAEEDVDCDRVYGLGFSLELGKPLGMIVYRNGSYPFTRPQEIIPDIKIDKDNQRAYYSITLPWTLLQPFRPLLDERAGINIRYTSQNDGTRKRLDWVEDPHYDTEYTKKRRFAPLYFNTLERSKLQFAAELGNRLLSKPEVGIRFAIYSPEEREANLRISVYSSERKEVANCVKAVPLGKGKTHLQEKLPLNTDKSEMYTVEATLADIISWTETFYRLGEHEIHHAESMIDQLHELGSEPLIVSSISGLQYRLQELREAISVLHVRDDPEDIRQRILELQSLIDECRKGGSIYNKAGYIRTAFQSPTDDSLQPYSLILSDGFNLKKSYDLILGLHGSGVDEVNFLKGLGRQYSNLNMILVGPRGRGLSDHYLGQTEQDVIDMLQTVKGMFNIGKTFLCGFSMGGFGAWYLSFRHPEYFDGVAVISGVPFIRDGIPEHDMRNYVGNAKNLPYLVIHGTEDRAVNIEPTDDFVELLKKSGYKVEYIRVEGAGHGDINTEPYVTEWLKRLKNTT
jgi:hypothetical protein